MPGNTVLAFGLFAAFAIVAAVATMYMGPFGLVLLGLLTLLICNQYVLDESAPGWGLAVFRHRMTQTGSATERAASLEARSVALAPVRLYRKAGVLLVVAGAAGLAWRYWG